MAGRDEGGGRQVEQRDGTARRPQPAVRASGRPKTRPIPLQTSRRPKFEVRSGGTERTIAKAYIIFQSGHFISCCHLLKDRYGSGGLSRPANSCFRSCRMLALASAALRDASRGGGVQCRGRSPDPRPGLVLGGTSVTRDALRRHGGRVGGGFGADVHGIREDAAPTGSAAAAYPHERPPNAPRHCTGRLCLLLRPSGRGYNPDVTPHVTPEVTPRRYTLRARTGRSAALAARPVPARLAAAERHGDAAVGARAGQLTEAPVSMEALR
jgi:hypothetical protein